MAICSGFTHLYEIVIFHSYVSLPEGILNVQTKPNIRVVVLYHHRLGKELHKQPA